MSAAARILIEEWLERNNMRICPDGARITENACLKIQSLPARKSDDKGKQWTVINGAISSFRPDECARCDHYINKCSPNIDRRPQMPFGQFTRQKSGVHPGQRYGRLKVLSKTDKDRSRNSYWLCRCDCGELRKIRAYYLTSGQIKSCSCGKRK